MATNVVTTKRKCSKKGCGKWLDARNVSGMCRDCYLASQSAAKTAAKRAPKRPSTKRGECLKSSMDLRKWISSMGANAERRFSVQLTQLDVMAKELDAGDTSNHAVYRQLAKDILERVDRVYGSKQVDVVTAVHRTLVEAARERADLGWDG